MQTEEIVVTVKQRIEATDRDRKKLVKAYRALTGEDYDQPTPDEEEAKKPLGVKKRRRSKKGSAKGKGKQALNK